MVAVEDAWGDRDVAHEQYRTERPDCLQGLHLHRTSLFAEWRIGSGRHRLVRIFKCRMEVNGDAVDSELFFFPLLHIHLPVPRKPRRVGVNSYVAFNANLSANSLLLRVTHPTSIGCSVVYQIKTTVFIRHPLLVPLDIFILTPLIDLIFQFSIALTPKASPKQYPRHHTSTTGRYRQIVMFNDRWPQSEGFDI